MHSPVLGQCISEFCRRHGWFRSISKPNKPVDVAATTLLPFKPVPVVGDVELLFNDLLKEDLETLL
jgi:hypothetical protein